MRKIRLYILLSILVFLVNRAHSQTNTENYIISFTPDSAVTDLNNLRIVQRHPVVQYMDGLGRAKQTVSVQVTPNGQDMVQAIVYDKFGRQKLTYLPFARTNNGLLHTDPTNSSNWTNHYNSGELNHVFSEKEFDGSPLNRVVEQAAPGAAWQMTSGRTVKMAYACNAAGEVINWQVGADGALLKATANHYAANRLYKTITYDENWTSGKVHSTEEYKDKQGQVVLKRSWLDELTAVSTYYVYDDYGLLRYVLPPKAFEVGAEDVTSTELSELCYQYKYDIRKRMTEKKLPGADAVYLVYDKRDRLVATQDGNQRSSKNWMYTKYDVFNRPVQTGIYTHTSVVSQSDMASLVDDGSLGAALFETVTGTVSTSVYSNGSFPNTNTSVLSETYYDNYDMLGTTGAFETVSGFTGIRTDKVRGQVTGTMTKVLDSSTKLYTVNHYDEKYRIIQSYVTNINGGYDRITTEYDFVGKPQKSLQTHKYDSGSTAVNIETENGYDHAGRLLTLHYTLDGGARILMTENTYNELGELINKKLHNAKQEIDYAYNIRGWLTGINKGKTLASNRLFGMDLYYNTALAGASNAAQYNGNISAIKWNHQDEGSTVGHAYKFEYDNLNRLAKADYGTFNTAYAASANFDVYGNSGQIDYDFNGNIESLMRNGGSGTLIDNLSYTYGNTNQLSNVRDLSNQDNGFDELSISTSATEYTYDANGNMKTDLNKGLNVQYNLLNLPKQLTNISSSSDAVEYTYSASGEKLEKLRKSSLTNTYIGNFVYKGDGSIDYIITPEGRLVNVSSNLVYEYYLKDHLGNTRNAFQIVSNTVVQKQKMDYYPFGMQLDKAFVSHDNKYLYNGKELQDDQFDNGMKLDWLDYGARMYDPALGRFHTIDPFAAKYSSFSPYVYVENDPINFLDPDGREKVRWEEVLHAMADPVHAISINKNRHDAFNAARKSGLPNARDGRQDAFRHAYWNALNTVDAGSTSAKNFATLHELGTNPANNPKSSEYDPVAIKMDLYNNEVGVRIGVENSDATPTELYDLVMQALANGELNVISLKPNEYVDRDGNICNRDTGKIVTKKEDKKIVTSDHPSKDKTEKPVVKNKKKIDDEYNKN